MAVSRMPKDYCDLITRHNGLTIDFCGSETFFYAYSEKGMAKGMDEDVGDWHQQEERPTTDPFSICVLMLAVEEVECAWIYHPTELNSHGESCLCRFDSGGAIEKTEYSIKDVLLRYLFSLLTL